MKSILSLWLLIHLGPLMVMIVKTITTTVAMIEAWGLAKMKGLVIVMIRRGRSNKMKSGISGAIDGRNVGDDNRLVTVVGDGRVVLVEDGFVDGRRRCRSRGRRGSGCCSRDKNASCCL